MQTPETLSTTLRILVIDDSVCFRKIISDTLQSLPQVNVIGTAVNGEIGWQKILQMKPDLITLDIEMPDLNGVELLRRLKANSNKVGILMLSSFTTPGAAATTEALQLGAFDFVLKPSNGQLKTNLAGFRSDLGTKLDAFCSYLYSKPSIAARGTLTSVPSKSVRTTNVYPEIVVIGISTGGPEALNYMLPELPADLPAPVLIVQHMPPVFTRSLAEGLNRRCQMKVSEGEPGELLSAGNVYIAPGGRQMGLKRQAQGLSLHITDAPPENSCRPSADYLFRSAAELCGKRTLAIIMTGMGNDGTIGCRLLKHAGATIIAQDRDSCIVYGMPLLPTEEGLVDIVAPLENIATQIVACVKEKVCHAG